MCATSVKSADRDARTIFSAFISSIALESRPGTR